MIVLAWAILAYVAQPEAEGHKIGYWLKHIRAAPKLEYSNDTNVQKLVEIGPACLPYLKADLHRTDTGIDRIHRNLWTNGPIFFRSFIPAPIPATHIRANAAEAISKIGPGASPLVPDLIVALNDPDRIVRQNAAHALRYVGCADTNAVQPLIDMIKSRSPERGRALDALSAMGPAASPAVPTIIPLLKDRNSDYLAAGCLGRIGADASNAVDALVEVLNGRSDPKDQERHAKAMAAQALGQIGVSTTNVIAALVASIEREPSWVRHYAVEALQKLKPQFSVLPEPLISILQDTNGWTVQIALEALPTFGSSARAAPPAIEQLVKTKPQPESNLYNDKYTDVFAARAFVRIAPERAAEVLPVLLRGMDDYCWETYQGLLMITNPPVEFRVLLEQKLKTAGPLYQLFTAHILATWYPSDHKGEQFIRGHLRSPERDIRATAARILWQITGKTNESLPVLVESLTPVLDEHSQGYPQNLEKMGSAASGAIPALRKALWHPDQYTRQFVGRALQTIEAATNAPPHSLTE